MENFFFQTCSMGYYQGSKKGMRENIFLWSWLNNLIIHFCGPKFKFHLFIVILFTTTKCRNFKILNFCNSPLFFYPYVFSFYYNSFHNHFFTFLQNLNFKILDFFYSPFWPFKKITKNTKKSPLNTNKFGKKLIISFSFHDAWVNFEYNRCCTFLV